MNEILKIKKEKKKVYVGRYALVICKAFWSNCAVQIPTLEPPHTLPLSVRREVEGFPLLLHNRTCLFPLQEPLSHMSQDLCERICLMKTKEAEEHVFVFVAEHEARWAPTETREATVLI